MSVSGTRCKHTSVPWAALLTTAAVGVIVFAAAKRIRDARPVVAAGIDDILSQCASAVEQLEHRVATAAAS